MLTSTGLSLQNDCAVEKRQRGLGSLLTNGAMRHLSGGIFVRACKVSMGERCGTSKDVLLTVWAVCQPAALRSPSWQMASESLQTNKRTSKMQETLPCTGTTVPVVSIVNQKVTALSSDVAAYFGKNHFHVLRDIDKIAKRIPDFAKSNFGLCFINNELANGKSQRYYRMTRDGFVLLVMGWTGAKALQFKLAWLDAFNKMEARLKLLNAIHPADSDTPIGKSVAPAIAAAPLDPDQQEQLRSRMNDRWPKRADLFRAYSILQHHFRVYSYRQIPAARFQEVMHFIDTLEMPPLNPNRRRRPSTQDTSSLTLPAPSAPTGAPAPDPDDWLVARWVIVADKGEPRLIQMHREWKLVRTGNFDWMRDYCETMVPIKQIPTLLKVLASRLQRN